VELPVKVVDGGRPGVVAIPHGWGSRVYDPRSGGAPEGLGVNRNLLIDRADIDPLSQTPALNATPVRVEARVSKGSGVARRAHVAIDAAVK
jgi:formate dehydrogenase